MRVQSDKTPLTDVASSAAPGGLRIRVTLRSVFMSKVPLRGQYRVASLLANSPFDLSNVAT